MSDYSSTSIVHLGLVSEMCDELGISSIIDSEITKGYSRDHHPELNQVMLNLIVENSAGIPLYMEALNGNSSNKAVFIQIVDN